MDNLLAPQALNYIAISGAICKLCLNFLKLCLEMCMICDSTNHEGGYSLCDNILGHQGVGGGYSLPGYELFGNLGA